MRQCPHTSLFTCHCSHVTAHTSLLTLHCSHVNAHTSLLTRHCLHVNAHTPGLTCHCSHVTGHTSMLTRQCPHVSAHMSLLINISITTSQCLNVMLLRDNCSYVSRSELIRQSTQLATNTSVYTELRIVAHTAEHTRRMLENFKFNITLIS